MKVLVEGIKWVGMWSEWVVDALESLGHEVDLHYCNKKGFKAGLVSKTNKIIPATRDVLDWETLQQGKLNERLNQKSYDLLFSVMGKLDSGQIEKIRRKKPDIKIVYWLGDFMGEPTIRRFEKLLAAGQEGLIDAMLVSYHNAEEWLTSRGFRNVVYFPFGVSAKYHALDDISAADRSRFSCDVSFVGTHYPERADLIKYLNEHLDKPVQVWGRGWSGSGVSSNGRLNLSECLKVYACSRISLNIQHHLTEGGFNIKYYEIPAVGGFELCDWQEEVERSEFAGILTTYRSKEELVEKIQYYLEHENERLVLAEKMKQITWTQCNYVDKVGSVLNSYVL